VESAQDVADVGETALSQQAGRDRRPVSARAIHDGRARGVEFTETPEERPYGIDSGFRDPSGNHIRLTQVRELAAT